MRKLTKYGTYEVRLVGENVENGLFTLNEALTKAKELDLDLVEINAKSNPPIVKIMNYEKVIYDKKRSDKKQKAIGKKNKVKEIRFGPTTGEHDFNFKLKHAKDFLTKGFKVKAFVFFKGRAITHKEVGELLLLKFLDALNEYGLVEQMPKLEGKRLITFIKPKK